MRKAILYIFLTMLVTILGATLFQVGNCYPEHGTDTLNFCSTSSAVYFLWKSNLGGIILFFIAPIISIILQVVTFWIVFKENKSLSRSYFISSLIPVIYGILYVVLAWYRKLTNQPAELSLAITLQWALGVIFVSYIMTFVSRLFKR